MMDENKQTMAHAELSEHEGQRILPPSSQRRRKSHTLDQRLKMASKFVTETLEI